MLWLHVCLSDVPEVIRCQDHAGVSINICYSNEDVCGYVARIGATVWKTVKYVYFALWEYILAGLISELAAAGWKWICICNEAAHFIAVDNLQSIVTASD